MDKISRSGHRERLRKLYNDGGGDPMQDYLLLELLLTYSIPRKDVKDIAYNLINAFGSLENIFTANITELEHVDGIGNYSATLITLVNYLNIRISKNKNENMSYIKSDAEAKMYFNNLLKDEPVEVLLVLTLDNNSAIIGCHEVGRGTVNTSAINIRTLFETILRDKASSIIIAHNHPNGESEPSGQDINITLKILEVSRSLNIYLIDHIIVGKNSVSTLRSMQKYTHFFD